MTDEAWIDTVRLARDHGAVSQLVPRWCEGINDVPHLLFDALRMASVFLSFDELPEEERPPKRIWLNGDRLREWFEEIKRKRKREAGGDSGPIEDPVDNEAAQGLLIGA